MKLYRNQILQYYELVSIQSSLRAHGLLENLVRYLVQYTTFCKHNNILTI